MDADSPEDARVRHKQALLEASEDSLSANEVGYYMDILEARLIQQVRSDSVSMSREGNTFILKLSGGDAFSSNRSRLKPDVHDALGSIARVLEEYRDTQISIYGHTDDAGEEAYNQKLSERRAQSVARYLIDGGLAANRIVIIGYGETRPSASNETAEGRALNRRIELRLEPLVQ